MFVQIFPGKVTLFWDVGSTVEDNGLPGWVECMNTHEWENREDTKRVYVCMYVRMCTSVYSCVYLCICM